MTIADSSGQLDAPTLSEYRFKTIDHDGIVAFSRGLHPETGTRIVIRHAASIHVEPEAARRIENEYALRSLLHPDWALVPRALARYRNGVASVFDDYADAPLVALLHERQPTAHALSIARGAAAALKATHSVGLIHRSVTPHSLFVDDDGRCRIGRFGVAVPSTDTASSDANTDRRTMVTMTGDATAYMSPEHTGRTRHAIDQRSDLYSLGVIFYELLTGQLPFRPRDPSDLAEWIHGHLASTPKPPQEIAPDVPWMLSRIVLKLLEKSPAQRYQSAAGLEADLVRCAAALHEHGEILSFALGQRDLPAELELPDRLYARDAELAELLDAFGRAATTTQAVTVALTGPSGVGKSTLMRAFVRTMQQRSVFCGIGKADQFRRDVPYAVLADAIQAVVDQVLGLSGDAVRMWQLRVVQALGAYGRLAARIAPALLLLVDDFPPAPPTEGADADVHIDIAMRSLVQAFAQPDRPLALFIDDVQWLDQPSLSLLARLASTPGPLPLFLVCSARVSEGGPLPLLRQRTAIQTIAVGNWPVTTITTLLAAGLRAPEADIEPLAQLVHAKTLGNPFFVKQFLHTLTDEGQVSFSSDHDCWRYDLAAIEQRKYTDNVAELALHRLQRLPQETRELLGGMASLGARSAITLLCDAFALSEHELHQRLSHASAAGLTMRIQGEYAFTHDRIQEAVHGWIDDDTRAKLCLRAGRLLIGAARDDVVFRAVNLLARAEALVTTPDESLDMAGVFSNAAQRARRVAAYDAALAYVETGTNLLRKADVQAQDFAALEFSLLEERAICWFLQGRIDDALALATELLRGPVTPLQEASIYRLKIEIHMRRSENAMAVETAIAGLRRFDIALTPHPSAEFCDALYDAIRPQLDAAQLDALLAHPQVADPQVEAATGLLSALLVPASFTDENLPFLTLCETLRLMLAHGMTGSSAVALSWLGLQICDRYQAFADGFRYAEMARRLVTHRGYTAYEARTLLPLDQLSVWTQSLSYSIECARAGFAAGVAHGDLTTACYECCHVVAAMLVRGDDLDDVRSEVARGLEFVRRAGYRDVEAILLLQLRFADSLREELPSDGELAFDLETADTKAGERLSTFEFWYWLYRATTLHLGDRLDAARICLDKAAPLAWSAPAHIHQLDLHLYRALTIAAESGESETRDWEMLRADARQIRDWAQANPATFTDKALLVEGEIARLEGDALTAMSCYEQAIAHATAHGFAHIAALAHERAARHCTSLHLASAAAAHFRSARDAYRRWGATGKVRLLETQFPDLDDATRPRPWRLGEVLQTVDTTSVIKASRALTEEIRLDKLIDKLMTVALEYVAAQRALLIRIQPEGSIVEAQAETKENGIHVHLVQMPMTSDALPISMFHAATRTGRAAIVGDATRESPFVIDPYLAAHPGCSAICIPLVRHDDVTGALYLENRLVRDAFTLDHVRLLELIAAQAAISLRTARLYADLLAENEHRQRVERELRASEASLAMGESVSHTGSWRWDVRDDRFFCSDELRRIFELDPSQRDVSFDDFVSRMHPEDRATVRRITESHIADQTPIHVEYRIVRADGSVRYLAAVGKPMPGEDGALDYVGTVTDITARRQAEDALRAAQADLARVSRATTVGQLTSSITHEINQPLMSIVTNAGASLRWLTRAPPTSPTHARGSKPSSMKVGASAR
ncbi:Signal transduction histidine kinase CheA [Labilithrix luteola]|uniref:Signal transduction histidine kinase CheA n=1 Tax=Labilithrix luteola TaxID=1391654 RepID=A0A0K1PX50_9BACT|nr:AAA family ATPase [Labilithrix luteola]AKU97961.1 Signal transduction histidine kinase CheA [Labilithrix luteola]